MNNPLLVFSVMWFVIVGFMLWLSNLGEKTCIPYRNDAQQYNQYDGRSNEKGNRVCKGVCKDW